MSTTDGISPRRWKRRWFQFSLPRLLVAVSVIAVIFAWIGYPIGQTYKETDIAAKIRELKGTVTWGGLTEGRGKKGRSYIGAVDLSGTKVTDNDLIEIGSLPELTHLYLNNTQISSAGLAHLTDLQQIKQIELSGTPNTDEGLTQWQNCPVLKC